MGQIRWTTKAATDLEAIHTFISKGSVTYASRFIRSLIAATERLEAMPYLGRVVPELARRGLSFREIIHRNYRIIYRVVGKDEVVEVLTVVHGSRDLKQAFQDYPWH